MLWVGCVEQAEVWVQRARRIRSFLRKLRSVPLCYGAFAAFCEWPHPREHTSDRLRSGLHPHAHAVCWVKCVYDCIRFPCFV